MSSTLKKILVNKAQCSNCKEILESTHRHHMVACKCFFEHSREIEKWRTVKSKYMDGYMDIDWHNPKFKEWEKTQHGVAVDGGTDYLKRLYVHLDDIIELSIEEGDDEEETVLHS